MKLRILTLLHITSLFYCVGNFFPGDEETGRADQERCVMAGLAYNSSLNRGQNCDFCLAGMLIYCNKKESKQLIQF